jgi:hypothetical protein
VLKVMQEIGRLADALGCSPEMIQHGMLDCKLECSEYPNARLDLHRKLEHALNRLQRIHERTKARKASTRKARPAERG